MRTQLGQLGIAQVDQAGTPNDAIKYIRNTSYDIIICDYNLNKETNGQQMLEFLRSQKLSSPTTMFFMVTGESSYDSVASAAAFQPDAYMVKPLTGGKIADRTERLLDRQNAVKPITDRLQKKYLAGAITECDRVVQTEAKSIVDILKLKAGAAPELGQLDDERLTYTQALALRSDMVWARLGLARCEQAAGRLDEAKILVQDILDKNTQFVGAYDLLAQTAESQGKDQEALKALNKSYEVVPSARRSRMIGDAAYSVGDLDQARTAYSKALNHMRGSLTAQAISAGALIVDEATRLMRNGQFDESLAKLEEALTATPDNTGVLLAAAQLHLLWMSQKGLDRSYVARVNGYLVQLDGLMPNSEHVAKMYRFLRETLVKVAKGA